MARGQQIHAIGEQVLLGKLRDALAVRLYREAKRLGLSFRAYQVASLCHSRLRGPTGTLRADWPPSGYILRESSCSIHTIRRTWRYTIICTWVSQEMRKRLGQYITPSVIVKYILDAAGYREDADILDIRLAETACGSGIFLVEAIRVYLAALRRAGDPN